MVKMRLGQITLSLAAGGSDFIRGPGFPAFHQNQAVGFPRSTRKKLVISRRKVRTYEPLSATCAHSRRIVFNDRSCSR
jgi:hypothetical protein